ncbi:MAG: CPBP family intramembrane glutamic endopeptidase [Vicinamibacteria bacterium]
MTRPDGAIPFARTVRLLLGAAVRRANARTHQNRKLLGHKGANADWVPVLAFLGYVVVAFVHGCAALALYAGVDASQRLAAEASGRRAVRQETLDAVERIEREAADESPSRRPDHALVEARLRNAFRGEAGRSREAGEALIEHHRLYGRAGFVAVPSPWGFARRGEPGPLLGLLGSLVVGGWFVALVLQGEGLEFDLQRRRHPMWEWLLGHPVDPRAVFLAEMLAPLLANPFLAMAPVFSVGAFWIAYDHMGIGVAAGLAAGLTLAVAAACATKAVEIVSFLRLPVRSRGAVLGILAWIGQAAQILLAVAAFGEGTVPAVARWLSGAAVHVTSPLLGWALGLGADPSPWRGVLACWLGSVALAAVAIQVSARATRHGLAGAFGSVVDAPRPLSSGGPVVRLLRDPLHRKELLWLRRDRSALIQVFLVPLTAASFQLFNFRHLLVEATGDWHLMAGASVLLGTYFLMTLGPRALLSEGAALWIALTWPRGIEDLLRAKARLWFVVSCVIVLPLLLLTALRFPEAAPKVALVAALWVAFSLSLAEKGVTLVTIVRDSGEADPIPAGRRLAASLGTFTFAIGVVTQRWTLALAGVVFSWMTAAAMWQNLRARLPFLFDPWSERLPQPPTVTHGMISISAAQEVMAILTAFLVAGLGIERMWFGMTMAYGVTSFGVAWVLAVWLARRGVRARTIWRWADTPAGWGRLLAGALAALGAGLALGVFGEAYVQALEQLARWGWIPALQEREVGTDRVWLFIVAVGLAPVAEEYLFRGLLFKSLSREWGFGRAVFGSACFFAIYHQPLAWIPMGLVGAASALLFRRSGHLAPSVVLHMTYNAVVVGMR